MIYEKHYDECYFLNYSSYKDINLYEVGTHKCPPQYEFGPIIRNRYVFHYIFSGSGTIFLDNVEHRASAGQCFVLPPNTVTYYIADDKDPWSYIWVHIDGAKAVELLIESGITTSSPVFVPYGNADILAEILLDILAYNSEELYCIARLFDFFAAMAKLTRQDLVLDSIDGRLKYVKSVIDFINAKYYEPIRIQQLANHCGLERSYLTKLFKAATGFSPQEYLIMYRIKQAKLLLEKGEISIQHIAYSVGYSDQFAFSKAFKKCVGSSPSEYRELMREAKSSSLKNAF